jgi:hypothetical protein
MSGCCEFEMYGYSFGFNGMESDNEITGSFGNTYTTIFRSYDSRIGRWWSIDPETGQLPWECTYLSMEVFFNSIVPKMKFSRMLEFGRHLMV